MIDWLATARHPRFNRPYTDLVYQPMLELLAYLRANQFKTFIVSGGGIEFMRPWTERIYGIPPEQVVGSSGVTKYVLQPDGVPVLMKEAKVEFIDDGPGKPVGINQFIGRDIERSVGSCAEHIARDDRPVCESSLVRCVEDLLQLAQSGAGSFGVQPSGSDGLEQRQTLAEIGHDGRTSRRVYPGGYRQDDGRRTPFLELCFQMCKAIDESGGSRRAPALQPQQPRCS